MKKSILIIIVVVLGIGAYMVYAHRNMAVLTSSVPVSSDTSTTDTSTAVQPEPAAAVEPNAVAPTSQPSATPLIKSWSNYRKPDTATLRTMLSPLAYTVTQEQGTERPFSSEYAHSTAVGIYVDVVSGEPLFSSRDKYDSGTGWPSFVKPITADAVVYRTDPDMERIEVRSKYADSHLGHVFDDGPADRGGKRFCMNGVALRFVPKDQMQQEGYGAYLAYL